MRSVIISGPREPDWVRRARDQYWAREMWRRGVEARICATDSGMSWLMRLKGLM